MGSLWCSVAVCVALVWIFLPDFNCEQLEVSHKYWIYACSPMPDLQATSGVCTTSISFEVHIPLRRGKYFCTTNNCCKCDIYCAVFLSRRLDTMECSEASDGAVGPVAIK